MHHVIPYPYMGITWIFRAKQHVLIREFNFVTWYHVIHSYMGIRGFVQTHKMSLHRHLVSRGILEPIWLDSVFWWRNPVVASACNIKKVSRCLARHGIGYCNGSSSILLYTRRQMFVCRGPHGERTTCKDKKNDWSRQKDRLIKTKRPNDQDMTLQNIAKL